jgi:ubiquinone/menaquinone biosynthesis C-methylase UbiE
MAVGHDTTAQRPLNIGCGRFPAAGWINLDRKRRAGVDLVADLRRLPFADGSIGYAAAIHVLQDFAHAEIVPVLEEIARVLRPGGVLRLGLPDLDKAIAAYGRKDVAYFQVADQEWQSLGAKLVTQIVWFGDSRTPFTLDFALEALRKAGFEQVRPCPFGTTLSAFPSLATLDNRERESLFVEATRPILTAR